MTMLEDSSLEQFVTQQLQSGEYQSYEERGGVAPAAKV
jgi:hypothetical protein